MKQMKMKPFFGVCWKFVSLMVPAQSAVLLPLCCGILGLGLTAGSARAQGTPGVTDKEVTIGSCSALEGPSQFLGTQTVLGASTYFQVINDEGGVHGRRLKLITRDDSYDPEKVNACFNSLMDEKVFAMAFLVGTPTALKHAPLAEAKKIPVVGLFTGAQGLRVPLRHYVINVRASYFDETREQVEGLWNTLRYRKIGVIYPDDSFGATVLDGVKTALKKHDSAPVAGSSFPRQTAQVDNAIDSVRGANPDAVVLVGPYAPVAAILKKAHAKGWKPMFLTVSFVGTDELIHEAGADAEGMVITQVVPPYYLTDLKGVALYRRSMQKYHPGVEPSFVSLEGFVDAMVLVEGLKRAGREFTREKLIQAIESIHDFDVGLGPALKLNYSAKEHQGFNHVIPTVVRGGRAVPFADWDIARPSH
jgi:ABC-type branched-subunit amino acid transport system substrate-binding protein